MARRRRLDTYTDELPREKADRLAQEAVERRRDAYAALLTHEGWDAFLRARVLHRYSWRNCALIAAQAPDALQLATFRQWLNYGYQVRAGEHHAAKICVRKGTGGFGSCTLFDVTQTSAAEELARDEEDCLPTGFAEALQALSAAHPRPRKPEDVPKAGEAIERAHKAQEGLSA